VERYIGYNPLLISRKQILLAASEPKEVALNAWLKLCRLDVNDEIEKWARVRK
jgi:hypothetical protein